LVLRYRLIVLSKIDAVNLASVIVSAYM